MRTGLLLLALIGAAQADGIRSAELGRAEREALSGRWTEAIARVERASDLSKRRKDRAGEACAAASRARIEVDRNRFLRYDPAAARRAVDAAVVFSRPAGAPECLADALHEHARLLYADRLAAGSGDWAPIAAAVDEALALRQGLGPRGLAHSRFYRGLLAQMQNRFDDARPEFTSAATLAREAGDIELQASADRHLAMLEQEAGRIDRAIALFERSHATLARGGFRILTPFAQQSLAAAVTAAGQADRALALLRSAVADAERFHSYRAGAVVGLALSRAMDGRGDRRSALEYGRQALAAARRYGDPRLIASIDQYVVTLQ